MIENPRFDPAIYDKNKLEDLLNFETLSDDLYDSLHLEPNDERAWDEEDVDAFVRMLLRDEWLLEKAATLLPVLSEPFVSRTQMRHCCRIQLTRYRLMSVRITTTWQPDSCFTKSATASAARDLTSSTPAIPRERLSDMALRFSWRNFKFRLRCSSRQSLL